MKTKIYRLEEETGWKRELKLYSLNIYQISRTERKYPKVILESLNGQIEGGCRLKKGIKEEGLFRAEIAKLFSNFLGSIIICRDFTKPSYYPIII